MTNLHLFDVWQRTDASTASYGEDMYTFLDRVAGPFWDEVRSVLDDWFSRLPEESRPGLGGMLRSGGHGFWSAYWELLLHEVFLGVVDAIEVDPVVLGDKTPDFRVTIDGQTFLVEATVLMEPQQDQVLEARSAPVLDALKQLETGDFWVDISSIEPHPEEQASGKRLRQEIQDWLDRLDPDIVKPEQSNHGLPGITRVFKDRGWKIGVRAIPRDDRSRVTKGFHIGPARGRWVNDHAAITADLREKARKYREANEPIILAVWNRRWTASDEAHPLAFYGAAWEHAWMMQERRIDPSWRNCPEGLWITRSGTRYDEVRAVLTSSALSPWDVSTADLTLWHNPSGDEGLLGLPFGHVVASEETGELTRHPAISRLSEILGLSDDWPPGEPFHSKM